MTATLHTLIKLQKTRVDERRLVLARLQEELDAIETQIDVLARQQEEQKVLLHKKPEMSVTYGPYLAESVTKRKKLEKKRITAVRAVELALDKLAEMFEEQKRYEIAQTQRDLEEMREEAARETKILDEVGSVGFIRQKKAINHKG